MFYNWQQVARDHDKKAYSGFMSLPSPDMLYYSLMRSLVCCYIIYSKVLRSFLTYGLYRCVLLGTVNICHLCMCCCSTTCFDSHRRNSLRSKRFRGKFKNLVLSNELIKVELPP